MKKTPKFLRTIRANKAPIIIEAEFGMKVEPYNAMDPNLIKKRAHVVQNNEKFDIFVIKFKKSILTLGLHAKNNAKDTGY